MINQRANFLNDLGFNPSAAEAIDCGPGGGIEIKNSDNGYEIVLYDNIGFDWSTGEGVTAKMFVDAIASAGDREITVRINSPGGDVFDGLAMYNSLKNAPNKVNVVIDGLAASAASIVAMSGDDIKIHKAAQVMIHSAWTIAAGNSADLRDVADVLDKIDGQLAGIYSDKTGSDPEEFLSIMAKDNFLTSAEALEWGLVDSVIEPEPKMEKDKQPKKKNSVTASARTRLLKLKRIKSGS